MEFRRRHNMTYATLQAFASMETVGIVTEDGIELSHWLGVADRRILRLVPELKSVLLDIEAWRTMILEPYKRLGPGVYMVGAFIGDGRVVGVMEGRQPMVRVLSSKPDALGRSFGHENE
ncbi:hypothetical protein [Marinobacter sp.]|uniref:hypothetical protein n=1 Tax=Marinobacter sp. TaxID=50741 RepID=UPI0035698043